MQKTFGLFFYYTNKIYKTRRVWRLAQQSLFRRGITPPYGLFVYMEEYENFCK